MKQWIVACDSCPYRHRFDSQSRAHQAMTQHATENPQHNPRVTEEER
jgi:hypothetical protein